MRKSPKTPVRCCNPNDKRHVCKTHQTCLSFTHQIKPLKSNHQKLKRISHDNFRPKTPSEVYDQSVL
ncbi:hypothetical protein [Moraxella lacunata]|uniref:hypothetical protein n=1 Tax=Moraxella lacunata TaxID=477 RepID=UPI003EE186D1